MPVTKKWIQDGGSWSCSSGKHVPIASSNYYLDLKSFATSTCNLNPLSRQLDSNDVNSWTCRMGGTLSLSKLHDCKDLKSVHQKELAWLDTFMEYRECASGHARSHGTGQTFATGKPIEIMCCCMSKLGPFSIDRMNAEFLYCSWKSSQAAVTARCPFSFVEGPSPIHIHTVCPQCLQASGSTVWGRSRLP